MANEKVDAADTQTEPTSTDRESCIKIEIGAAAETGTRTRK